MTWLEVGKENLRAAKLLHESSMHRSAINRPYYAAYACVTAMLEKLNHTITKNGRPNPAHSQVVALARHNLSMTWLTESERRNIARKVRSLLRLREAADYDPESSINETDSLFAVQAASFVVSKLESNP